MEDDIIEVDNSSEEDEETLSDELVAEDLDDYAFGVSLDDLPV